MKRFVDIAIRFFPAVLLIAMVAIPASSGAWTEDEFERRPLYAFPLPHGKDDIIGNLATYEIRKGDTLLERRAMVRRDGQGNIERQSRN